MAVDAGRRQTGAQTSVDIPPFLLFTAIVGLLAFAAGRGAASRSIAGILGALRKARDKDEPSPGTPPPLSRAVQPLWEEISDLALRIERRYEARLKELARERSKTAAIIESVEDGLILLDHNGAVVHINEVACAILDLDPGEVAGRRLEEPGTHNLHVEKLLLARAQRDGGQPAEFKVFLRGRDHSYISRELPWTSLGGERLGSIVLLQDVTFVRDLERSRNNLIATLSHELKTPLTSLAIGAELLSESAPAELGAREREIFETIREDVARLNAIASDLLDASRTSAARIGVERRAILLDRVVRDACRPLAIQARERHITFEVLAGDTIPIWGDPIKLPWVITNLVGNSLRYTPPGGRITLELKHEGTIARTLVTDTGPGIAPELLARVFEPFAQFPDEAAHVGSAGLGLYIAKEIVEAHNGRIFARSEPGHGTTFIVDIPMREEAIG